MSALARLLIAKNEPVSGSDIKDSPIIRDLKQAGADIHIGHDAKYLPQGARVVVSSMIQKNNPELAEAQNPIHRSDLLNELMQGQKACIVAGTHGKTTTSSLLAHVMKEAEIYPSYAVGGIIKNYGLNAELGTGPYFVAEADESDGTHIKYQPYALIVTNIDKDHMEHYGTEEKLIEGFKALIYKVSDYNLLFTCGDDPILKSLKLPGEKYGFDEGNTVRVLSYKQFGLEQLFTLSINGQVYSDIFIPLIGRHNVLNAAAVFALAMKLNIPEKDIRCAFSTFKGVDRRADFRWEKKKVRMYDDYAHHPEEVNTTINAFKEAYPSRRLIIVFQPHRFSRLKDNMEAFSKVLKADIVVITDVYAASENPIEGITGANLSKLTDRSIYIPRDELAQDLSMLIRPFDVIVSMGAGDITHLSRELEALNIRNLRLGLVFGGKSKEHEVSFLSCRNIYQSIDRNLFDVTLFAVSKDGGWASKEKALAILDNEKSFEKAKIDEEIFRDLKSCDIVFPCLHGTNGEDGTIQGFFEILDIAYIGCNVESAAIAMNKALTKRLAVYENIPVVPFVDFIKWEWEQNPDKWIQACEKNLQYPLFVKPVHLGSTFGVKKVKDQNELIDAIEDGFKCDSHLIVETGVDARELEISVMGAGPYTAFNPGEIVASGTVYDFDAKYGVNAFKTHAEASLTEEEQKRAKEMAVKSYQAIRANGMARVDLFYLKTGEMYLNEINPIPGFTQNSLFPKMCAHNGLATTELINHLSEAGLANQLKRERVC